jgi:predicted transcriptional regulator
MKEKAILIRMDPELHIRISHQAKRLQMDKSAIVRMALVKFLEEQEPKKNSE